MGQKRKTPKLDSYFKRRKLRLIFLILPPIIISLISLLFLYQSFSFEFTNFDDPQLLVNNKIVKNFNTKRMITEFVYKDYLPLTFFSFALENKFFGMNPQIFHITNVILHILNIFLVYFLIIFLTEGRLFLSAFTTFLFAIFPTQPESVVWISERKDVLSGFFFLLSTICYIKYVKIRTSIPKKAFAYSSAFFFVLLSLLSKASAITIGFIFIAIDLLLGRKLTLRLLIEKIPFFVMGAVFIIIHIIGHDVAGEQETTSFNIFFRLLVGIKSYFFYLARSIFPFGMSSYYEKNSYAMPALNYVIGVFALLLILFYSGEKKFEKKWSLFGIGFFTALIIPVLNIVPLRGSLLFADRYLYLSGIGLFLCYSAIIEYKFVELKKIKSKVVFSLILACFLSYYLILYHQRIKVWQNSLTLWSDIVKNSPRSVIGNMQLALAYHDRDQMGQAISYAKKGLYINPKNVTVNYTMGMIYFKAGKMQKSLEHIDFVIKSDPLHSQALSLKALILKKTGKWERGKEFMDKALKINPMDNTVMANRAIFFNH